jgi:Protein of unknown function (DUF3592)
MQKILGCFNLGCGTIFLIPFVLVGFFMMGAAVYQYKDYKKLNENGTLVEGRMLEQRFSESDDSTYYYITFEFAASNDQRYVKEQGVSREEYERFERGGAVDIEYDINDPTLAKIAGTNTLTQPAFLFIFGLVWNGIISVLIGSKLFKGRFGR